jgi:hypothetical protein
VKTRGSGGGADDMIPMLLSLEMEFHRIGVLSFERKYNVNLTKLASMYARRWSETNGAERRD